MGSRAEDFLPLTHIVYHVLLSLAGAARHGYGIIKDVEARTDGRLVLEAGTLYAAIKRLRDEGLIEEIRRRILEWCVAERQRDSTPSLVACQEEFPEFPDIVRQQYEEWSYRECPSDYLEDPTHG